MKGSDQILFIDITSHEFNPTNENLDPVKLHKELHSKDKNGQIHVGVDTFILIWSQIEKLKWLVPLAQKKPIKKTLQLGYRLFIELRPYLPRKNCESSPYCEVNLKK